VNGREHYGNMAKGLTNAQTNTQLKITYYIRTNHVTKYIVMVGL